MEGDEPRGRVRLCHVRMNNQLYMGEVLVDCMHYSRWVEGRKERKGRRREEGKEGGGREGGRREEGKKGGGREGGREEGKKGGKEGGKEEGMKGGKEGGKEDTSNKVSHYDHDPHLRGVKRAELSGQ